MTSYLKRLIASLAAYQVADVVSKFIAILLLPVYTRYIAPAGYGKTPLNRCKPAIVKVRSCC